MGAHRPAASRIDHLDGRDGARVRGAGPVGVARAVELTAPLDHRHLLVRAGRAAGHDGRPR